MYQAFFGFTSLPFSIVPNSKAVFLGVRHTEALQHLQVGLGSGGGFALLTGEVGTGKTTVAKMMLSALDHHTQAGFILNPTFSSQELLEAICDEFAIAYPADASVKRLSQSIYQHLLDNHSQGRQTLLVIDEAQHLAVSVLEQLRLLTNLETNSQKLLKVLLVGQPELQQALKMPQLRQLAQRITGRYHLLPFTVAESKEYIQFRLQQAGGQQAVFSAKELQTIAKAAQGVPRLINLICDHALQASYQAGKPVVSELCAEQAAQSIMALQGAVYSTELNGAQDDRARPSVSSPSSRSFFGHVFKRGQLKHRLLYSGALLTGVCLALIAFNTIVPRNSIAPSTTHIADHDAQGSSLLFEDATLEHLTSKSVSLSDKAAQQKAVYPEVLQHAFDFARNKADAMQTLYHVWGFQGSVADTLCTHSTHSHFMCQLQQTDWQTIVKNDVPVVLALHYQSHLVYAVLYAVSMTDDHQQQVELLVANQRLRMDWQALAPLWQGESWLVWPTWFNQTLKLGDTGSQVVELDRRLNQLLGETALSSDRFDQALQSKVMLFQRWQGLTPDGIAGKKTLNRIEQLSAQDAPRLQTQLDEKSHV